MKKMFTLLTLMFLLPLSVNAEIKEFKDKVYVTGEHDIKDYYCEELKDKENVYYSVYQSKGVVLFDETDIDNPKRYLLDMKNKKCKSITEEEFESLENNNDDDIVYDIRNDKIYEVTFTDEGIIQKYVKSNSIVYNKEHYILENGKYVKVDNPVYTDIDKYYEVDKFGKAQGDYYDYIDYYIIKDDNTMILDDTKTEDEFKKGLYYERKEKNSIYKEVAKLIIDKFILKKEISGLEEDMTFEKIDLMEVYKIYDKFYVSVEVGLGAEPALALFDLEGNPLVIDGHSLFGRNGFILSGNNLLSFMVAISENKSYNYIIDKDFNIINKKEFDKGSVNYIPLLINTNEHIDYFTTEGLIDSIIDNIIEIRNYYLISGDKKYNNKDMNYELSANLKELKSVFINDKEISKEKYTTKDNKLTLNNKYLSTLEKGNYKLKVLYNDGGFVNTNFTVDVIANPPTGDNILKSVIFGSISLIGLIVTVLFIKKRKMFN